MDFLEIYNLECKVALEQSNHDAQTAITNFNIFMMESVSNKYLTESQSNILYESKLENLGQKIILTIDKIIKAISDFASKVKEKVVEVFTGKDTQTKLKEIETEVKSGKNLKLNKKQIEMFVDEENKKRLDEYIKQMVTLERKLMNVKVGALVNVPGSSNNLHVIEANEILHEIDKLNQKYDAEFLSKNDKVIKMAAEDALRFNEKQLQQVKVDYEAVEKGSKEVLAMFKKDAKGCNAPVKLNGIQKMSNSIGTKVRQFLNNQTKHNHSNLKAILALASLTFVGEQIIRKAADNIVSDVSSKVMSSDSAKGSLRNLANGAIDKVNAPDNVKNDAKNVVNTALS